MPAISPSLGLLLDGCNISAPPGIYHMANADVGLDIASARLENHNGLHRFMLLAYLRHQAQHTHYQSFFR